MARKKPTQHQLMKRILEEQKVINDRLDEVLSNQEIIANLLGVADLSQERMKHSPELSLLFGSEASE